MSSLLSETFLVAIVAALASVITSLIATSLQWRKWRGGEQSVTMASAAGSITDTSIKLVDELRKERQADKERYEAIIADMRAQIEKEIAVLEAENRDLQRQINELRQENEELRKQIK